MEGRASGSEATELDPIERFAAAVEDVLVRNAERKNERPVRRCWGFALEVEAEVDVEEEGQCRDDDCGSQVVVVDEDKVAEQDPRPKPRRSKDVDGVRLSSSYFVRSTTTVLLLLVVVVVVALSRKTLTKLGSLRIDLLGVMFDLSLDPNALIPFVVVVVVVVTATADAVRGRP